MNIQNLNIKGNVKKVLKEIIIEEPKAGIRNQSSKSYPSSIILQNETWKAKRRQTLRRRSTIVMHR